MLYKFPYPDLPELEIPAENLIGIFESGLMEPEASVGQIISEAMGNPIGMERLANYLNDRSRVLILSDDNTRATPVRDIIPLVLEEIHSAGVKTENVKILMALGTHRPMSPEELLLKLGSEVCRRYEVINHRWDDQRNLIDYGRTDSGIRIKANKLIEWSDFTIAIGGIIPHAVAGFSGGGKMIVPGICGEETSGDMHWHMSQLAPEELFGVRDNPVRKVIDEVAVGAGLKFIVNCITNNEGQVVRAVAGDPVRAHRVGTEHAKTVHGINIPEKADIVIFDSYLTDIEYWQAIKAITPAGIVAKEGAILIQVAECREGVSKSHGEVLRYGYHSFTETKKLLETGCVNKSVAAHMIQASFAIKEAGRKGYLISPYISKTDTERLGFLYAPTPAEALENALSERGKDARIIVLRQAGDLLPVFEGRT